MNENKKPHSFNYEYEITINATLYNFDVKQAVNEFNQLKKMYTPKGVNQITTEAQEKAFNEQVKKMILRYEDQTGKNTGVYRK